MHVYPAHLNIDPNDSAGLLGWCFVSVYIFVVSKRDRGGPAAELEGTTAENIDETTTTVHVQKGPLQNEEILFGQAKQGNKIETHLYTPQ